MKEANLKRAVILLVGSCLWIASVFQAELADYGIYTLMRYSAYELLTIAASLLVPLTLGWLLVTLWRILRRKAPRSDLWFCLVLLLCFAVQLGQFYGRSNVIHQTAVAEIQRFDEDKQQILITASQGDVTLDCPMLVWGLLESDGREYLLSFETTKNDPSKGKLYMAQAIPQT